MRIKLTNVRIAKLEPPVEAYDLATKGLSLRVTSPTSRHWYFRFTVNGRSRRMAFGPYPEVSIEAARTKAGELRAQIRLHNIDPQAQKQKARERAERERKKTFGAVADAFIEQYAKPRLRSWRDQQRQLRNDIPKSWRRRPIREITKKEVERIVERKAVRAPIASNRLRSLLHKLWAWAIKRDLAKTNPVKSCPKFGVEKTRERELSDDEVRHFWKATEPGDPSDPDDERMSPAMSAFWRLRLVTAQRAGEIRDMRWSEIDFERAVWTIDRSRVKNKKTHRVPLSDMVLEIVTSLPKVDDYVLVGGRGVKEAGAAMRSFGFEDFRGHDLRRTAATIMTRSGVPQTDVARVLNHSWVDRHVTAVYDRHDYADEKRRALDTLARAVLRIVEPAEATVVAFRR